MTVSKSKKNEVLQELTALVKEAESIAFTQNSGLSVSEITTFRDSIRESNAKLMLAKKTLIKKAMKDVHGVEIDDSEFEGQIGIVFSFNDPIEGLSAANAAMKKIEEKMEWACGFFDWEYQNKEQIKAIAGLPTKDTLLGRMVGSLMSPLSSFVRFADSAAKEVETQGKENLSQIEVKKEGSDDSAE